jgi:prepilin-type N-terminal cleavage/methylation domain-containing protein
MMKTSRHNNSRRRRGFSMTEMVTTISVISVLGSIAIVSMGGALTGAKEGIALQKLEELNRAVHDYNQASSLTAYYAPLPGSTTDEHSVLLALRSRASNPDRAKVGSPFVQPMYNPSDSSDPTEYRITWVGTQWSLLRPGTSGTGLRVVFDNSDMDGSMTPPDDINALGY